MNCFKEWHLYECQLSEAAAQRFRKCPSLRMSVSGTHDLIVTTLLDLRFPLTCAKNILDEDHSERKPSKTSSTDAKPDAKTLYQAPTLPFNILITCEKDIKLLSNISQDAISNSCMCENAVSQTMPPGLPQLKHIERLNMVHQIPELGVVAIANQAGRVALLTMTFYQPQRQPSFKIEAILPYESQEKKDVRPEYQLVGMAISPVQGQQARAPYEELFAPFSPPLHKERGTRRWRLMMTYMDHTILSYEISRPRGDLEVLAI